MMAGLSGHREKSGGIFGSVAAAISDWLSRCIANFSRTHEPWHFIVC